MAIPDYQTIMTPLLRHLADGLDHDSEETREVLGREFNLNEEELQERLTSGQRVFANRIAWSKSYLKKAGLLNAVRRGVYRITDRGRQSLSDSTGTINNEYLKQFPEFTEFVEKETPRKRLGTNTTRIYPKPTVGSVQEKTPEELLEIGHQRLRDALITDLLSMVKGSSPAFFERVVIDLLIKMGYGGTPEDALETLGRGADGGIDGIINEDRLGLESIYVQAKRWEGTVGRPEIQKFAGAIQGQRARKGVFVTTSEFTREAIEYTRSIDYRIVLIDGQDLAKLMIDSNVGVGEVSSYTVKRIDTDYFSEE